MHTITLTLPDDVLDRLRRVASAMRRPLEDVLLRALRMGSPPSWEDAPTEIQGELAAMGLLEDDALFTILRERSTDAETSRYEQLQRERHEQPSDPLRQQELESLREESDRRALRRAHAAVLLRWRGRNVPLG